MRHPVKLYPTLTDHGDRFAAMWTRYHSEQTIWRRYARAAQIVLGCVAGVALAWGLV